MKILHMSQLKSTTAEIYVNNKLKYVEKLQKDEKKIFVPTDIGGINIEIKNSMIRVISSNSPRKLIVKQGWAKETGDLLIGIPDKVVIKITGTEESDIDYVAK